MYTISTENLKQITRYLTILWHSFLFRRIWRVVKKQTIFIDPTKYEFNYEYRKMWIGSWHLYVPIAKNKGKEFITPERFTKAKDYQVVFLQFTNS